jgi:hypothetical protein
LRTLRQFAFVGACCSAGAAYALAFRHGHWAAALLLVGLGLALGVLGVVRPGVLRPVFVGWLYLTFPVNWVVTHVLLAVLFYAVLTPVGWFCRLIGRDVLALRRPPVNDSYWRPKPAAPDVRSYFRMS